MPSVSRTPSTRPLRKDARENQERILEAARIAFAEHGLDASVEEIAERAGVGMGTLYRRFPSKTALVDAIFEDYLDELAGVARRSLADPNPWEGFTGFLEAAIEIQVRNRGFAEICAVHRQDESLLARARARVTPLLVQLIDRAQSAGALRADVVYEDISILLWTSGRVVDSTREVAPEYWRRHLALTLDGLATASASPLPRAPLSPAQHTRAMAFLARQLRLMD
jgi:AcrR family transcriptional regulator